MQQEDDLRALAYIFPRFYRFISKKDVILPLKLFLHIF